MNLSLLPLKISKKINFLITFFLISTFLVFVESPVANASIPAAPTITAISRVDAGLNVAFTAPSSPSPAILNYEYSIDGGSTWTARSPESTSSPISITGLTNCQTYSISIRAVNADGSGTASEAWNGVPGTLDYQLNNGLMKFGTTDYNTGTGDIASIQTNGSLKQPWYKNSSGGWSKMTYYNYALNFALGVGGDGTNEWNVNGTLSEFSSVTLSRMTIDCSQFVTTSTTGTLAQGYGTLTVSGLYTFATGEKVEITRSYAQTATSKYTTFKESIKNVGNSTMSNARLWVGTQDDWIGNNDSNSKARGNIVDGVFQQISSAASQSKVLKIYNGTDTVYFYTTSNLGYTTGLNRYGAFNTQVMQQNPATASVSVTNDGSYGMYLRFQDIAPGASESFTWYYIASSAAQADSLLGNVASAALPGAPTINSVTSGNSQATVDFSEGTSGGSTITNYQYSTDGGTTWQTRSPASTSSPLVITGLANGTLYNVKLRAINSEGSGTATSAEAVTPLGPPDAPLITSLTQTSTSISVGFTAPADGGASISNYLYSINGGSTWVTPSPAITSSPFTISGLTPGTDYEIILKAVNSEGESPESGMQSVTTFTTPSAPTIGTISPGNASLSVPFTFGNSGGTPITNIEYSLDGGATWETRNPSSTYSPILITGYTDGSTFTNLVNGTTYNVALRAVNSVGHSVLSNVVSATPVTVPSAVVLPANTNVTPSNQTLTVNFTAPANGGSDITTYEYSTDRGATWRTRSDGGGTSTSNLVINKLSSDGTTSLTNGQEYCIQLRAVNVIGSGQASNDVCSTPKTVPDALSSLVTTSRDRAIEVAFALGGNGGSPITDIEYCLLSGGICSNWISAGTVTSPFTISGLTNGTAYTVSIRAKNSVGASSATTDGTGQTPASNPSAPTITNLSTGSGSATITFTAPSSDGGISIANYEYSIDSGATWTLRSPVSTASPLTISGLTNGDTYGFAIRAKTASTTGISSSISFGTPSTTPAIPTDVSLTPFSGRISVSFTVPNDGGSPITNFEYALSTNSGSSYTSFIAANVLNSPFTISGLTNGTAYLVKIYARNANGSGTVYTSSAVTPTGVPDSPVINSTSNSKLTASLTDRQISVTFTEPANNGSTITNYQYSTDGGSTWRNRTDSTGRFSPLVISKLSSDGTTDLSVDTLYSIKIRAINSNGTGDGSTATSARTGGAVDSTPPTASLVSNAGSDSASRSLTYQVTFSETVQGIQTTDFVKASGTATCSITSVSTYQGTSAIVSVNCSTDGTYQLRMNANTVSDGTNLGPTSAVTASIVTIDTAAPTATVTSPAATSSSRTLSYAVTFSSTVTGISTSDFTKTSGTASCSTTAVSASSGSSVTFTVTCSTDGTVVMTLGADSVTRNAFTGPVNATAASSVTIDSSVPTATITTGTIDSTRLIIDYEIEFSESVSGVSLTDFIKSSGTATCQSTAVSASSGTAFTFTVTCSAGGTIQMKLLANSVTDGINTGPAVVLYSSTLTAGTGSNSSGAASSNSDSTAPSASIISPAASTRSRNIGYTVNFSEFVSGIEASDFIQRSGTANCSTSRISQTSGTSVSFSVICSTDGTVTMQLLANSVSDGTNSGPTSEVVSREVFVGARNVIQPTQSPSPTPSVSTSVSTRGPVYYNGNLPEVTSSTPLAIVSGIPVEVTADSLLNGQEINLPSGVSVSVTADRKSQVKVAEDPISGLLQVTAGDKLVVKASGLKPGSQVEVWLFSSPRLLGVATVASDGSLSTGFDLGQDIPAGKHTAQVSAIGTHGAPIAVNTGIEFVVNSIPKNNSNLQLYLVLLTLGSVAIFGFWFVARRLKRESE